MKTILLVLMFIAAANSAQAGSAACTGPTVSVTSGAYAASGSDCVISVDKSVFEFTYVTLPTSPSDGDEVTVKENTTAQQCSSYEAYEYEGVWYPAGTDCYPAGVGINTDPYYVQVGGSNTYAIGSFKWFVKAKYDSAAGTWNVVEEGPY